MNHGIHPQWSEDFIVLICEQCDWRYLGQLGDSEASCPNCFHTPLTRVENIEDGTLNTYIPESVVPTDTTPEQIKVEIERFSGGIPFSPGDLIPANLLSRIRRVYLPLWLVDAGVSAIWQAEFGFDYQVVSHQDQYNQNQGGWRSREITETRVRWEPRIGRLDRTYDNVIAPALEEDQWVNNIINTFDLSRALSYQSVMIKDSLIRLPDREPEDAWEAAKPAYQKMAADECRKAGGADHIRQFSWKPEFANHHWTLMLLPMYSTFYLDDDRKPQRVFVNGQNSKLYGARCASIKRAQKVSLWILLFAVVLFILSIGLSLASFLLPPLLAIGVLGLAISMVIGLGAIYPIAAVWWFNRQQMQ